MSALKLTLSFIMVSSLLVACNPSKETIGQVGGGVLGGVVASQVTGGNTLVTIGGALGGAWLGSYLGKQMDENDRKKTSHALENAKTNQPVSWKNPDNGNQYTVTPTKTYQENNQPCRDFTTNAMIDGKKETITGKACRQANGHWQAQQ
jgi:surface antigen